VADPDLALPTIPGGVRTVADSCLVVDSLGPAIKRELLDDFIKKQLNEYEQLFGQGKEHYNLEAIERRWAWFKRLLKKIDTQFEKIFPLHWRIQLRLCLEFVERTKMHLILLLTEFENNDNGNVHVLLKSLDSALRFEREMGDKFNILKELKESKARDEAKAKIKAEELENQKRLKKDDKLMYIPTDHDAENSADETESGFLGLAHAAISGGLSGVFDKFLSAYVAYERQQLEDLLVKMSKEEDTADDSTDNGGKTTNNQTNLNVYTSSTTMFVFIKKSINRCITLTTGQSFLALTEEFQSCMHQYIDILKARCPQEVSANPPIYRLPQNGEITLSYLINTGEYCAETVPSLEQLVKTKINPKLESKIDFNAECEAFMDLVAYCLKVLVYGMMDRLEPHFKIMQNTNWGMFSVVGEESAYLHSCNAILIDAIPNIRGALSSSYFQNFCTKLSTEFIQRLVGSRSYFLLFVTVASLSFLWLRFSLSLSLSLPF
jgi:hypothetical protein